MIKLFLINTFLVIHSLSPHCYGEALPTESYEYIPVYNCKEILTKSKINYVTVIDTVIVIKKGFSIHEKAELIARTVSHRFFDDLEIKVLPIDTLSEDLCLKIDLIESENFKPTMRPSWFQFFQGSTGGTETSEILISNFLQNEYNGPWIDKIKFYYQGEEFEEWEHIWLGEHVRYNFDEN